MSQGKDDMRDRKRKMPDAGSGFFFRSALFRRSHRTEARLGFELGGESSNEGDDTDEDHPPDCPSVRERSPSPAVPVAADVPLPQRMAAMTDKLRHILRAGGNGQPHAARMCWWPRDTLSRLSLDGTDVPQALHALLETHHTPRADWTHLWTDATDCTVASRIVAPEEAIHLYTLASYEEAGMSILERRVSCVARLAFDLRFEDAAALSTDNMDAVRRVVCYLDAFVHSALVPDLHVEPLDRALAFVEVVTPRLIRIHFPALAMSVEQMTDDWCRFLSTMPVRGHPHVADRHR